MNATRRLALALLLGPLALWSLAGCKTAGSAPAAGAATDPKTEDEKTLYALGNQMGQSIKAFSLTPAELDMVKAGISDAVNGAKSKVDSNEYQMKVRTLYMDRSKAAAEKNKAKGVAWAAEQAKLPGAVKTESGLVYIESKAGTGDAPTPTDRVKVNYEGKLVDGTIFDSSYERKQPAEFPLNGVIPCWTEGLQKMKVGGKATVICPAAIAYGDRGSPPKVPGGSTLSFTVELLGIEKAPPAPAPGAPGAPGSAPTGLPPGHP